MGNLLARIHQADLSLFRRISGWRSSPLAHLRPSPPSPLERLLPFLSWTANLSKVWIAIGAVLATWGGRSGKRAAVRGIGSIAVTSAIVNALLKPLVKRDRPELRRVPTVRRLARQPLSASFPSGHAASAFAFATGVALEKPKAAIPIGTLAATIAYSRTYTGVHYPLDVLGGCGLGAGMGILSAQVWPTLPSADDTVAPAPTRHRLEPSADGRGVALVYNPESGSGLGGVSAERLRSLLPGSRVLELAEDDDPRRALELAASDCRVVGVCGGDGSVALAAEAALARDRPLLLVPGGTMNHLARDLGIETPEDAAAALARGEAVEVDVARVDGRVFLNNSTFGAYTEMVDARQSLEQRIGRWPAQALALWRTLRHASPMDIRINGRRRAVWMVFVGNCGYHPRGIAPGWRTCMDDGVLDVRVVDGRKPAARLRAMAALVTNNLERSTVFQRWQSRELEVESPDGSLRVGADGETFNAGRLLRIEKHPKKLLVYAPHRAVPEGA
jgi:diacylglycerol kinase family enzyme/membrane-associated phospholipid phosphatase